MRPTQTFLLLLVLAAAGCAIEAQPAPGENFQASADSFVARRVLANATDIWGDVAPDGSFVSTPDRASGDLAVLTLDSGDLRRLTRVSEPWGKEWAEPSAVSHDGRRVAYTWATTVDRGAGHEEFAWQLRVIDREGGEARTLVDGDEYPTPLGWTAGDSAVVVQLSGDEGGRIALVPLTGGDSRGLLDPLVGYVLGDVSPDGRHLAFGAAEKPYGASRDVHVLDLTSGVLRELLATPANEGVVGWMDDATLILSTDAPGTPTLVSVRMTEGRPAWPPHVVRSDVWGLGHSYGGFRDGVLYSVAAESHQLYTLRVDPASAEPLEDPQPLTDDLGQPSRAPAWSQDGTRVAYFQPPHVRVRPAAGGEARELAPAFTFVGRMEWSRDGRRLFVWGSREGQPGTWELDLATGSVRLLTASGAWGDLSPDERTLVRVKIVREGGERRSLVELDMVTGREHEVVEDIPGGGAVSVSPDGRTAAVTSNPGTQWPERTESSVEGARLLLVDLSSGAVRAVASAPPGEEIDSRTPPAWSPDGTHVLFASTTVGGDERTLWAVTPGDGEPSLLIRMPNLHAVSYHPSGERLLFSGGRDRAEMWMLQRVGQRR